MSVEELLFTSNVTVLAAAWWAGEEERLGQLVVNIC